MPVQDRRPRPRPRPWIMIFILLSLLAHLLFVVAIVVISHFMPAPKLHDELELSSTSLSLEEPPPLPPVPPPTPKLQHAFMPTEPDAGAKHQNTLFESDNDTRLKSQSQVARDRTSVLPDIDLKRQHAANLHNSPNAPTKEAPHLAQPSSTPARPQKQQVAQTSPIPIQQTPPKAATAQKPEPNPDRTAKTEETHPAKSTAPKVAQAQLDPNGLPLLPALNAPTLAPASARQEETEPAASIPEVAQNVRGAVGTHGDDSVAAMATELGRYKAKVYRAVGSRWYNKVNQQLQVLPVGTVHIQFTIHSDGTVDTKVLEGDSGALQLLLAVSLNSIREAAPYDPFTPSMIKELGADEYTDDFTFSIYGGGD